MNESARGLLHTRKVSEEVVYATGAQAVLTIADLEDLKRQALTTRRQRMRICTHGAETDPVHEMFIVHPKGAYVRPHKHQGKSESFYVIEGSVDFVTYDDAGNIESAFRMGNVASRQPFYHRMDGPYYHTMLIRSDWLVFYEVTRGPFDRKDNIPAPWSPPDADLTAVAEFIDKLDVSVTRLLGPANAG
jgi:cupin fold WbuC family metalloprotein